MNKDRVAWNSQLGKSEHEDGRLGMIADAQFPSRYLLCKIGSSSKNIAVVAATSDEPFGVCIDAPFAQYDSATVRIPGSSKGTQTMIANGAIATGADVYSDGTGKVGSLPAVAGIYWLVGRVIGVASVNSGDYIEVEAGRPLKVIVLTEFTSITTAAASDLPSSEALANALKADLTALRTALATPALLKVL